MDYAQTALGHQQSAAYPSISTAPRFEGLSKLAERVEMSCDRLQRFIDRFHGSDAPNAAGQPPMFPAGHLGQLDRIERAASQLEGLCSQLDAIG